MGYCIYLLPIQRVNARSRLAIRTTTQTTSPTQMNITYLQLFISLLYLHAASLAKAQHRDLQYPTEESRYRTLKEKTPFHANCSSFQFMIGGSSTFIIPVHYYLVLPAVQKPLRIASRAGNRGSLSQSQYIANLVTKVMRANSQCSPCCRR
jgi:hypothetical protein